MGKIGEIMLTAKKNIFIVPRENYIFLESRKSLLSKKYIVYHGYCGDTCLAVIKISPIFPIKFSQYIRGLGILLAESWKGTKKSRKTGKATGNLQKTGKMMWLETRKCQFWVTDNRKNLWNAAGNRQKLGKSCSPGPHISTLFSCLKSYALYAISRLSLTELTEACDAYFFFLIFYM